MAELDTSVADAYASAELRILRRVARYIAAGVEAPDWELKTLGRLQTLRSEAVNELAKTLPAVRGRYNRQIRAAYAEGNAQALSDIRDRVPSHEVASSQMRAAVARVTAELGEVSQTAVTGILRAVDDSFRDIVGRTVTLAAARGVSRRDAAQLALNEAFAKGLKFKGNDGRNWRLPDYIEMATRTGVAKAQIGGHEDALDAAGLDLVVVHPGPRACDICDRWARKILSRSGVTGTITTESALTGAQLQIKIDDTLTAARAAGFQHPNCRCSIGAYIPGVTKRSSIERPPWDQAGYEAQQAQRGIERNIRDAKTKQAVAITPQARAKADAQVAAQQARMRAHMDANPDLKRQSSREQISGRFGTEKAARSKGDTPDLVSVSTDPSKRPKTPPPAPAPAPPKPPEPKPPAPFKPPKVTPPPVWPNTPAPRMKTQTRTPVRVTPPVSPAVKAASAVEVAVKQKTAQKMSLAGFRESKPEPMSLQGQRANPARGSARGYQVNCTNVVVAAEMRARGWDVVAAIRPGPRPKGRTNYESARDWVTVDGQTREFSRPMRTTAKAARESIESDIMQNWPVGARGAVSGAWKRGGGHIFNVERTATGIRYHEGQVSREDASGYIEEMKPQSMTYMRFDDLVPTASAMENVFEDRQTQIARIPYVSDIPLLREAPKQVKTEERKSVTVIDTLKADLKRVKSKMSRLKREHEKYMASLRERLATAKREGWNTTDYYTNTIRANTVSHERQMMELQAELEELERKIAAAS